MKNHLIILILLSYLSIHNLNAQETPISEKTSSIIINKTMFYDHYWHELEVQLSNGDTVNYTIYIHDYLHNAKACIYAEKVDGNYEKRYHANADWVSFMHNLYVSMSTPKRRPLLSQLPH